MNIEHKSFFITDTNDFLNIEKELHSPLLKALVIVGGDGTLHHALKYTKNISIPIGLIPAGSGNDFARALNIPKKSLEALEIVLNNQSKIVDIINVNEQLAASIVGVGFDAEVTEITNKSRVKEWLNKWKLGSLSYIIGVMRALFSYKLANVEIIIDGKKELFSDVWLIATANTPFYGGGLKMCPEANETDGILNVCIVHSLSRFQLLLFFPLLFVGKHTLHPKVALMKGKEIFIQSNEEIIVQADGELIGKTPVKISVAKEKLNVLVG